jgi:cullin-associated NEDD8-dissociated protein 1
MVTISRITANDTDLEVRQRAIHAIGVLLARTSGSEGEKLLPAANRSTALDILSERLKNETTRIAAVKAIDTVATLTSRADELDPAWARDVSLELGAQLRKANRTLRGASLAALKNLVVSPAGRQSLDSTTVSALVNVLSPLLTANDLHLLGPALLVLATLTRVEASLVVSQRTISSLCDLVKAPLGGAVLDALLILTREIGEQGVGQALMSALLKEVGVGGNIPTVGKVIGTLLVYGGSTVGVKLSDFTKELTTTDDDPRKCLALAILGEAGLRMGSSSPLNPDIFISFFTSKSDRVPLAAAVALGRAGAGDVYKYLPVILKEMDKSGLSQYLLLHSIKEILQHAGEVSTNIGNSSGQIWDKLFNISQAEDNKTVGAECIGRLTITEPKIYFPKLQVTCTFSRHCAQADS